MSESIQTTPPQKHRPMAVWVGLCKKHKLLSALVVLLIAAGILFAARFVRSRIAASTASTSYSFIRTTTLSKGSLEETVSVTGSVESADTSTVSYTAGLGSTAKVRAIHVAVGDEVSAGDVIVTLDTTDILASIAKAEESLSEQKTSAQENYDKAVTARDEAYALSVGSETTVADASAALSSAQLAFSTAQNSISAYQNDYESKLSVQNALGTAVNASGIAGLNAAEAQTAVVSAEASLDAAKNEQNNAQAAYDNAKSAADAAPEDTALAQNASAALSILISAQSKVVNSQADLDTAKTNLTLVQHYDSAQAATNEAAELLQTAKKNCDYDNLNQRCQQAQQSYNSARTALDNYEKQYENACAQVEQAQKALDDLAESDTLEALYDQLAACELTAETDGKVTALNATVGSAPNGTVAAIQNTRRLKISVTIPESDIHSVAIGMPCVITSDATEQEIAGTLSQIDPVAGQSSSFGAEVTVTDNDSGLLIGMNATVKIILSSTEDVFTVPLDAIGNDDKGNYVYRATGGSGVDMTFERVYVTVGESNDYYVEISAADLAAGDVIRSSSDLTQGLETVESSDEFKMSMDLFGSMGGFGDMDNPMGNKTGNRGQMNGTRPSGNFGGGTMPSGGFAGGN